MIQFLLISLEMIHPTESEPGVATFEHFPEHVLNEIPVPEIIATS